MGWPQSQEIFVETETRKIARRPDSWSQISAAATTPHLPYFKKIKTKMLIHFLVSLSVFVLCFL